MIGKNSVTRRSFLKKTAGVAVGSAVVPSVASTSTPSNEVAASPSSGREGDRIIDEMKLVTYCGLYCGLCAQRGRIPPQAAALKESMVKEGYEFWGKGIPGFKEFWEFLSRLCDPDKSCPGCRQGGGPPFCSIRKCARKRKVDVCVYCQEYPCERVVQIAEGYPTLISDGKRIKKIGAEAWIKEQEDRGKTGFAYADIRCHPFDVPRK